MATEVTPMAQIDWDRFGWKSSYLQILPPHFAVLTHIQDNLDKRLSPDKFNEVLEIIMKGI